MVYVYIHYQKILNDWFQSFSLPLWSSKLRRRKVEHLGDYWLGLGEPYRGHPEPRYESLLSAVIELFVVGLEIRSNTKKLVPLLEGK